MSNNTILTSTSLSGQATLGADAARLLSLIPADYRFGDIIQTVEAADGIVIVEATPDSDFGAYEITAYVPETLTNILDMLAEPDEDGDQAIPMVVPVIAITVQSADGIPAAVQQARETLIDRAAHAAASHVRRPAMTA
ncbi:hypothetical protein [Streptomyces goshikiensis]|uniref:hypothetical protein n=1 Tax=Streptomyces goshikiensis TaxID=1942 RepID=UPI0036C26D6E